MMKYLLPPLALVAGYHLVGAEFDYEFWRHVVPTVGWLTLALWWSTLRRWFKG